MTVSCAPARAAPFRCPTADELAPQALALLPRGRAWATSDGAVDLGSVLVCYWRAVSDAFAYANQRLCALREEFWCATHVETHQEWLTEYGLPDACDPFPDLCTKVAALGGTRCEYYAEIAARAGWSIRCVDRAFQCGTSAGSSRAKAGIARPGKRVRGAQIQIEVDLGESPSYVVSPRKVAKAGRAKAGQPLGCGPNIEPLQCLLERVVHAEIELTYGIIRVAAFLIDDLDARLIDDLGADLYAPA